MCDYYICNFVPFASEIKMCQLNEVGKFALGVWYACAQAHVGMDLAETEKGVNLRLERSLWVFGLKNGNKM